MSESNISSNDLIQRESNFCFPEEINELFPKKDIHIDLKKMYHNLYSLRSFQGFYVILGDTLTFNKFDIDRSVIAEEMTRYALLLDDIEVFAQIQGDPEYSCDEEIIPHILYLQDEIQNMLIIAKANNKEDIRRKFNTLVCSKNK